MFSKWPSRAMVGNASANTVNFSATGFAFDPFRFGYKALYASEVTGRHPTVICLVLRHNKQRIQNRSRTHTSLELSPLGLHLRIRRHGREHVHSSREHFVGNLARQSEQPDLCP
jgi:hypothetical protein